MTVRAFAPAKVNLTLHVTGRRPDSYHLLDSIVVFAAIGDRIVAEPAERTSLQVTGPEAAGVPAGPDNLVLRAAALSGIPARLTLEKRLPAAAGLGGGSSDAAATLRALARLGGSLPVDGGRALGADLPVCLRGLPARMTGIGETLTALPPLPAAWLVLVNPRVALETRAVFAALTRRDGATMPVQLPPWRDARAFADWLRLQRNDLEAAARTFVPEIDEVLAALAASPGCLLARMSGSGATCFGLFADEVPAKAAAMRIGSARPEWWLSCAAMLERPPDAGNCLS